MVFEELSPEECPICLNIILENTYIKTECSHTFCKKCILTHLIVQNNHFCPLCRGECIPTEQFMSQFDKQILDEIGILKITPTILDTGLYILDNMQERYIIDPEVIDMVRAYPIPLPQFNYICITLILMIILICIMINHNHFIKMIIIAVSICVITNQYSFIHMILFVTSIYIMINI
jgi:hypothetical protein